MLRCQWCDDKGEKSINPLKDDCVKDKKGYYHTECYILYLINKKKHTEEQALDKVKEIKSQISSEMNEKENKQKFYDWIKEYYDTSLPQYYCLSITKIRNGTHELVHEKINYETLLDIYKHMDNYLNKIAANKNFKSIPNRMNYDLKVVIGNIGDYKAYKARLITEEKTAKEIEEKLAETKMFEATRKEQIHKSVNEFDITDIIDDLLL